MADRSRQGHEMHHADTPVHADHDTLLIAGHAAGDLTATQILLASALVARCPDCAQLHRDLVALASATHELPRDLRAPRDYRLTPDQASRLRRGSRLRALLRPFSSPGTAGRAVAGAFTSLGVAGLLVAAFIPGMLGGAAGAPAERNTVTAAGAPTGPAAGPVDPMIGAPGASGAITEDNVKASAAPNFNVQAGNGGEETVTPGDATDLGGRVSAQAPFNALLAGSLGLLVVGLALFGLRFVARRVR